MLAYMQYTVVKLSLSHLNDAYSWESRVVDIEDIFLTFSYLVMLYGVSDSIRKSAERQIKNKRMRSELDQLLDATDSSLD